jgi:ABC-2 type transport system ATP-binding protein
MVEKNFLELKGVTKRFGKTTALDDVSFNINSGDVFGYIGPNGAGKTTTIKILVGLITDFSGEVKIGGMDMPRERNRIHKLLGYLPQNVSFQEWRTVDHCLKTFAELSEVERSEMDQRIERSLKRVGLEDQRNKKVKHLSGGNIQKLGLAQALLHGPRLLVLDEPLSGLDPASRFQVKEIVKDLSCGDTTVFFSSHILSDVQDVATRIGILNGGKIMDVGGLEDLKTKLSAPDIIEVELFHRPKSKDSIRSLEGVRDVIFEPPNGMKIKFSADHGEEEMSRRILERLMADGYGIRSFSPTSPDLDDLYMKYVREGDVQ